MRAGTKLYMLTSQRDNFAISQASLNSQQQQGMVSPA